MKIGKETACERNLWKIYYRVLRLFHISGLSVYFSKQYPLAKRGDKKLSRKLYKWLRPFHFCSYHLDSDFGLLYLISYSSKHLVSPYQKQHWMMKWTIPVVQNSPRKGSITQFFLCHVFYSKVKEFKIHCAPNSMVAIKNDSSYL